MIRKSDKFRLRRNIYLSWKVMDSESFKQLTPSATRVLLRFLQKRTWHTEGKGARKKTIFESTGLAFTYQEALWMDIKNTAFCDAIKRLVEVGFIDIEHQGGAYGKDYSRYCLSKRWRNYGTEKFQEVEKARSLPLGMDVRSNMRRKTEIPTEICREQLRESVDITGNQIIQGTGNP